MEVVKKFSYLQAVFFILKCTCKGSRKVSWQIPFVHKVGMFFDTLIDVIYMRGEFVIDPKSR